MMIWMWVGRVSQNPLRTSAGPWAAFSFYTDNTTLHEGRKSFATYSERHGQVCVASHLVVQRQGVECLFNGPVQMVTGSNKVKIEVAAKERQAFAQELPLRFKMEEEKRVLTLRGPSRLLLLSLHLDCQMIRH
jgi:hypothetical protein